jgi:hypothetical protein
VYVAGIREEIVSNAEQVLQLLKLGEGTVLSARKFFRPLELQNIYEYHCKMRNSRLLKKCIVLFPLLFS